MMIDRYQLRYFLAVVEAGNFSRAAAQVNVTQPTLSVGISKLEQALGVRLFLRNSQRVHLTEAGARFLSRARDIERGFAAMEAEVTGPQPPAVMRLGVLNTIPTSLVEAVVALNATDASPSPLEIVEGSERDLIARMHRRRIDLALTILRPGQHRLRQETLFREGYSVALPAWHPLAEEPSIDVNDLVGEVMIVRRHCELLPETSRHFTEAGVRPRFSLRTTNDDRTLAMVRAGLGVTMMPASFESPGVARPRLRGFDHEREIGLLYAEHADGDAWGASPLVAAIRSATRTITN